MQVSLNAPDTSDNQSLEDSSQESDDPNFDDTDMYETYGMIKVEKIYYNIIRKTKFGCGKF